MAGYYEPCPELDACNELIAKYWNAASSMGARIS